MIRHDPAKVITDLAVALALGGDCLADIAVLRAAPAVFGPIASDPAVSRTIDALAADAARSLAAIHAARAEARAVVWELLGEHAPDVGADADDPILIDTDATLLTSHSDKQGAAPTFKRGYGFHPLWAFVDHGPDGTGEPLAVMLRPGNAGSNTAADHIVVVRDALKQLPSYRPGTRPGRRVLIRADSAGCTHEFLDWLVAQRLSYSVGFTLPDDFDQVLPRIPNSAWSPAYDADSQPRDGAWVADITGLLNLSPLANGHAGDRAQGTPPPGRAAADHDVDGHRFTAFATNTARGQLADLELRHRRRARAEDRIRCAKDTGLTNLPLHEFAQNQIWCAIVALACELTAWMQMLAFTTDNNDDDTTSKAREAAAGSPNAYDCGCSRLPHGSPAPAAAPSSTSPATAPGPSCSSTDSPDSAASLSRHPANQPASNPSNRPEQPRPVEPATTPRRHSGRCPTRLEQSTAQPGQAGRTRDITATTKDPG